MINCCKRPNGVPISEEDQVVTLLGSLPRSFATLVTAIEARVDDVTLDYVQQALNEEMKQSELSGQLSVSASALALAFKRNTPRDRPTYYGRSNEDSNSPLLCKRFTHMFWMW